jgi:CRP-like cAMP-binding protein
MVSKLNSILNNIKKYVDLNEADELQLSSIVTTKNIKKRQFIVQPDFICNCQTYVIKGSLRSYFINSKGEENTIQFAIEDWFISDFNSYINQAPATLFVEALEDGIIEQISFKDVERICNQNHKFEKFFRVVAQKSFAYAQKRILSNLGKSAEERFLEFNKLYPQICKRVPQYMLASYLGITPEFLSKIKKQTVLKS